MSLSCRAQLHHIFCFSRVSIFSGNKRQLKEGSIWFGSQLWDTVYSDRAVLLAAVWGRFWPHCSIAAEVGKQGVMNATAQEDSPLLHAFRIHETLHHPCLWLWLLLTESFAELLWNDLPKTVVCQCCSPVWGSELESVLPTRIVDKNITDLLKRVWLTQVNHLYRRQKQIYFLLSFPCFPFPLLSVSYFWLCYTIAWRWRGGGHCICSFSTLVLINIIQNRILCWPTIIPVSILYVHTGWILIFPQISICNHNERQLAADPFSSHCQQIHGNGLGFVWLCDKKWGDPGHLQSHRARRTMKWGASGSNFPKTSYNISKLSSFIGSGWALPLFIGNTQALQSDHNVQFTATRKHMIVKLTK